MINSAVSIEIPPPIYRTNYANVESSAENWQIKKDAITILRASGNDSLVLSLIEDHGGNKNLYITKAENPEGHAQKLNAFLAINPDITYKAKYSPSKRKVLDSLYITTEEGEDAEVVKKFKEMIGKDLPVSTSPEYPNRIIAKRDGDAINLELMFKNTPKVNLKLKI
jgi:hypothetical protein